MRPSLSGSAAARQYFVLWHEHLCAAGPSLLSPDLIMEFQGRRRRRQRCTSGANSWLTEKKRIFNILIKFCLIPKAAEREESMRQPEIRWPKKAARGGAEGRRRKGERAGLLCVCWREDDYWYIKNRNSNLSYPIVHFPTFLRETHDEQQL